MINKDNQKKAQSGANFKKFLGAEFDRLKKKELIRDYLSEKNYSHKGYSYQHEYLANFIIETNDRKFIVIRSSTSFRGDRVKQMLWDLQGINENSSISKSIIASVLLFGDDQVDDLRVHKDLIKNKKRYSPASHLLTVSEFKDFLDKYVSEVEALSPYEIGSMTAKRGLRKEKELVELLNDVDNLKKLKGFELPDDSEYKQILSCICNSIDLGVEKIDCVEATDTIPLLTSGGPAKTDVEISLFSAGETFIETISVKSSSKDKVSCHEYSASDFIRVLGCKDTKLAEYINMFQKTPSYGSFKENLDATESEEEFTALMEPYARRLTEWALTGEHDNEKLNYPTRQVSKYLFINSEERSVCYLMADYINHLFTETKNFKYGVPFSWTYSSRRRGKSIQLKVPLG